MDGWIGCQGTYNAETLGRENEQVAMTAKEFQINILHADDYDGYDCSCDDCNEEYENQHDMDRQHGELQIW